MKRIGAMLAVATVSILGFMGSATAGAQSDDVYVTPSSTIVSPPTSVPSDVLDDEESRDISAPQAGAASTEVANSEAANSNAAAANSSSLALTGTTVGVLLAVGLAAVLGGLILVRSRKTATA